MDKIEDYGYTNFKVITEGWSDYTLEDGTIIRTWAHLLKISKESSEFTLNERSFATSFSPRELKGPRGSSKILPEEVKKIAESLLKEDIKIIIAKECWNEYELTTGEKIYSKAVLVSASLTDRYDDVGDPIYAVNIQVLHKIIPKRENKNK